VPVTHTFIQFDGREPILIGTPAMNVVPAAIVESAGGLAVEVLDHRVAIHPRHHAALHGLKSVEAGLRPQALRLRAPGSQGVRGVVFLREPLGLEDEVLVEAAGGTRLKAVTASGEEFPEGAAVVLEFAPRDLYLFQPESKETLCHGIDGLHR
jgi:ABC-type sugar transport system ATPase subunit